MKPVHSLLPPRPSAPIPHLGSFESTRIHGFQTDVLETTRHLVKWREDLDLLRDAGLTSLRYSAPWHCIEREPGVFDFSWMDGPMEHMRATGMQPIVDLLHHTSFPDWLTDGFANPDFPVLYARFVREFARRYEWVTSYTIFNEPLATTLMCSCMGHWYPFQRSSRDFVRMSINVVKAMCLAEGVLCRFHPNYTSVYIDTCESHRALDRESLRWAEFLNYRRFLMADLALGRVTSWHPLWLFLLRNGMSDTEARWFRDHPIAVDILGLDYYPHSEMEWRRGHGHTHPAMSGIVEAPRGFANVASDYVARYDLPVMLTETNVRGTVWDRITWLRFMEEQTALLARRADVRGFCWYPSIDSTDWCHVCARCTCSVDPQGIWYLDDDRHTRYASELSHLYSQLARGNASWRDLPAYRFEPPLDTSLAGYVTLMNHWDWADSPNAAAEQAV